MKIDKNIPLPGTNKEKSKYAFNLMVIGDSSFFSKEPKGTQSKHVQAARKYGSINGAKFVARTVNNGVRIWRTS